MQSNQQDEMRRQATSARSGVRIAVISLSALVIAFCAWSMSEYVGGRDPLAMFMGSSALQTTSEAAEAQSASTDQPADEKTSQADDEQEATPAQEKDAAQEEKSQGESTSDTTSSASQEAQQENQASETASQTVVVSEESPAQTSTSKTQASQQSSGSQAPQSTPVQESSQQQEPVAPQTMVVTISIDGGAGVSSGSFELTLGSTAFDALLATGVAVETIDNHFGAGTWVTSIGGLAEDATHGWTYRVNGSLPSVMSDLYELHNGDTLLWQYV